MEDVGDLDTFGVVWGELLSTREECADHIAEHAAFAAAAAVEAAAGALHVDAQANQDYMNTLLGDVDGRMGDGDECDEQQPDPLDLRGWQQQLRNETGDQADVMDLIEEDGRAAQREAVRARTGVPEEVLASQAQAFRQCKELAQDRAERTGRALSKTLSRLPEQPAPAGTLPPAVAPKLAGAQWWHEGPHVHNLFKWHSVQIQAGGGQ